MGHLPSPLSMRILVALMRSLVVAFFSDALSDVVEHEDDFASAVGFGEDGVGEIEGGVGWELLGCGGHEYLYDNNVLMLVLSNGCSDWNLLQFSRRHLAKAVF